MLVSVPLPLSSNRGGQDLVSDTLFADHYELVFGVACTGAGDDTDTQLGVESIPLARALHGRDIFPIHAT